MKAKILFAFLFVVALCASCGPMPEFVVNSAADDPDVDLNDDICETANGNCTLRAAIGQATALDSPTGTVIKFQNVTLINVPSELPHLTGGIRIRGEGKVTLDGGQDGVCGGYDGLVIEGSNSNSVQGLTITGFGNAILIDGYNAPARLNFIGDGTVPGRNVLGGNCHGIYVQGKFASENWIRGNYIGTTAAGTAANPNVVGIVLVSETHENIIGDIVASALPSNVISGNEAGIQIYDSDSNQISSNYIGTTKAGTAALANTGNGIEFLGDSSDNLIGVDSSGKSSGNVISGNQGRGISIRGDDNIVAGNFIGTTNTGMAAVGNGLNGIMIELGSHNVIGTNGDGSADDLEGNVISANGVQIAYAAVEIDGTDNIVAGNFIGTNKDGTAALGNKGDGILLTGDGNRVGTDSNGSADVDETNVISGNENDGIYITSAYNVIAGNRIGTNAAGDAALGNFFYGVYIAKTGHFNMVGINGVALPHATGRNIISANGAAGGNYANVFIQGDYNLVGGNLIGPNANGSASIGSTPYGVTLSDGATGNIIGTNGDGAADASERNLISGNKLIGVRILDGEENHVAGNYIGTDLLGVSAVPNALGSTSYGGVYLGGSAVGNFIGTDGDGNGDAAEGNVISGNDGSGVEINGESATNNVVAGNYIGTDKSGIAPLGNTVIGVNLNSGASGNRIGTNADGVSDDLEANVISANGIGGVWILIGDDNEIAGNFIGTDKGGTAPLPNSGDGVHLNGSNTGTTNNNSIGGSVEKSNVIAFNMQDGVEVMGYTVYPVSNSILFNSIFDNEGIGINLGNVDSSFSVTMNDAGDGDIGGNDLLNFPELQSAQGGGSSITITGQIVDGLPNKTMQLQFFANGSCDPTNFGEGQAFLGGKTVSTNASGDISFSATFNQPVNIGLFITSTATTDKGTSEFSECVQVVAPLLNFTPLIIVPSTDINCRTYCSVQADIADILLAGVEYSPVGWDAVNGFLAFRGPTSGELCFAPPVANGNPLMALSVNGETISADQLNGEVVESVACPLPPTLAPTPGGGGTPACSDGIDNDGDRLVDLRDPDCRDQFDDSE